MSNKQEFPISSNLSTKNAGKKPSKSIINPYIDQSSVLQNDYTRLSPINHDKPAAIPKKTYEAPMLPNPIIQLEPYYNTNFDKTLNFSKINAFPSDDNIHDSFKFSEFQKDYRSEETLSLKSIEEYSSYDLTRNKSKFRNINQSKISTIFQNKINENLKFIAQVFKAQIEFIQTLDQMKQKTFELFNGNVNKICQIFLGEQISLDFNEFANIFKQLEIRADLDDIKLMFWRFGVEKIGLDINGFKRYFTPMYQGYEEKRTKIYGDETQMIANVLKMNLNFEYSLEMLRKEIKEKNVGLREVFDRITMGEEFLSAKKIRFFLSDHQINVNDEDVEALLELYDPNKIGLTFKMFYQEILPKIWKISLFILIFVLDFFFFF